VLLIAEGVRITLLERSRVRWGFRKLGKAPPHSSLPTSIATREMRRSGRQRIGDSALQKECSGDRLRPDSYRYLSLTLPICSLLEAPTISFRKSFSINAT
jgi:hypothetical protein